MPVSQPVQKLIGPLLEVQISSQTMIFRILSPLFLAVTLLTSGAPARAEWFEASSDHFVIYADDNEADIRAFAENLERYHGAMEEFTGRVVEKPSPSNRITVFVTGSAAQVRKLAGTSSIAGFYIPRASGSVAFVQDIGNSDGYPDLPTVVLLHEYAHHFLTSTERFAMPLWMSEGAAEFFSAAYFHADGSVFLGQPARHRFLDLYMEKERKISIPQLLQVEDNSRLTSGGNDFFYGQSWLLYSYLSMTPDRSGQLKEYWIDVLKGTPSLEAGRKSFGELGVLERQIDRYLRDRNRKSLRIEPEKIALSEISLRPLSAGESAIMETRMQLQRGVDAQQAADLAASARELARLYADDAAVLTALAHAEYAAGNDNAAISAADRALAIDAGIADAYVYKGRAMFRKARAVSAGAERDAAYEAAMTPFTALNGLENNHTAPLIYSFRSYLERGVEPTPSARDAFVRAARLAPFDRDLWLIVGMTHMNYGEIAAARNALQPLASAPHGDEKSDQVKGLLTFLASKQEGEQVPVLEAITAHFRTE